MPPLILALQDESPKVRSAAAEALGSFPKDDNAFSALMKAAADPNVEVRRSTVLSLGRLGNGDATVEELLRQKLSDEDGMLRSNAVIALALMGKYDDTVLPQIAESLGSRSEATAKAASRALASIGPEYPDKVLPLLMKALDDNESSAARFALPALRKMKKEAAPALPKVAAMFKGSDASMRSEVLDTVSALDEKGDYSLPIFVKSLESDDPIDRKESLIGLLKFKSNWREFLAPLVGMLDDPEVENRLVVVAVLKGIVNESDQAVSALTAMTSDSDIRVKISAISALSNLNKPSEDVFAALTRDLAEKDHRVRMATIGSLRRLGREAPDRVISILDDSLKKESYDPAKRLMKAAMEEIDSNRKIEATKN